MPENPPPAEAESVGADAITPRTMPVPTVPPPADAGAAAEPAAAPAAADAGAPPPPATGEVDAFNVPFDPARHNHVKNKKTGAWMPKKPRRAERPPGNVARPPPASVIPPGEPPPPAAEPDSGTAAAPGAPPPPPAFDVSSDAAEVGCRSLQFTLGLIFDCPEDFTPPAAEHKKMVEIFAAWIRARGWSTALGWGVVLTLVAWLLKVFQAQKPREKIREWVRSARADNARDVTPAAERPAASSRPGPGASGPVIDLPPGIPPFARS